MKIKDLLSPTTKQRSRDMAKKKKVIKEKQEPIKVISDTQRKLNIATTELAKLENRLENIMVEWTPLEAKKNKVTGDIKYYSGRVEKLTARLQKEV